MANIHYKTRDALVVQAKKEIEFAYKYKKARMASWNKNEDMYYGRKDVSRDTMSNVEIGKMQGYVHTILSKIDSPLVFKYTKGEASDAKKVKLINALREKVSKVDRWNAKDLQGKKQAVIYGRAVYLYYADQDENKEYRSNLSLIDVKDFLIDPDAGGDDVEKALYLGWWNTKLSKQQLEAGAKKGIYYKAVVEDLVKRGTGNTNKTTEQDQDKKNRFEAYAGVRERTMQRDDQWKFYTWITTSQEDGERYYLVFTPDGDCVRCEKWEGMNNKRKEYPVWTWACFPDAFEFWTPSYCDYARDIFLAQGKSINQMIDNSDKINEPQTAVNVDYVKNLAQVKYKKSGYIEIEGNVDVNRVLQTRITPAIEGPLKVYSALDQIVQAESGVTAGAKGTSEEETLGIYEGNLMQAGDRFGLLNKSYADGYLRFAGLFKWGVMGRLKKKTAVRILGPMGLEIEYITAKDLKPYQDDYDILVESSAAEAQSNLADQKNKITFLGQYKGDATVNQKVLFEIGAGVAGFDDDTVRRLLNPEYGEAEILSEADETFQRLIGGHDVPAYKYANTAFMQRLVDLSDKYDHELTPEQHAKVFEYINTIAPVVEKNMARSLADEASKAGAMPLKVDTGAGLEDPNAASGALPIGNEGAEAQQTIALQK